MNITKGIQARPPRIVIYGPEGIGKSTLAASAPAPLFLDTEQGSLRLPVDRVQINSLADLREALRELYTDPAPAYKTLVIDTADRLWTMCAEAVCIENKWDSIEAPQWGKGYIKATERFVDTLHGLEKMASKGCNIVIVCHAKVATISPPDNPEYSKYCIKVTAPSKQAEAAREFLKEWCDALLFCHYDIAIDREKNKALGAVATRVISTSTAPAWEAKNRFNLPDSMPMSPESLTGIFAVNSPVALPGEGFPPPAAPADDDALLVAYFIGIGRLSPGQTLADLPPALADAVNARRDAAIAKARAWKNSHSH